MEKLQEVRALANNLHERFLDREGIQPETLVTSRIIEILEEIRSDSPHIGDVTHTIEQLNQSLDRL